ncbi:hypothetical protein B9Z19DRAFT_1123069 [Tuber borchii]|uniref:Uncharacterized protein n=1 Tax=Tuber borchii TaxID=42251 RepID=A0A2T6ZZ18_TUBBO|nr:hypothetical protein B9Z19DRAFT_1123069 [Tuber borchii]
MAMHKVFARTRGGLRMGALFRPGSEILSHRSLAASGPAVDGKIKDMRKFAGRFDMVCSRFENRISTMQATMDSETATIPSILKSKLKALESSTKRNIASAQSELEGQISTINHVLWAGSSVVFTVGAASGYVLMVFFQFYKPNFIDSWNAAISTWWS